MSLAGPVRFTPGSIDRAALCSTTMRECVRFASRTAGQTAANSSTTRRMIPSRPCSSSPTPRDALMTPVAQRMSPGDLLSRNPEFAND